MDKEQLSIHPRNWKGGSGEVRNTSKPWKGKGKLAKKQARLNKRRLEHSATLRTVPAKFQRAYKSPGSMNPKK